MKETVPATMGDRDIQEAPLVVIKPVKGWVPINFQDIWTHRELLYFLAWRDIKVKYKQTVMGAIWAVLQPFFKMVVFSLIFGGLLKISSDGKPYPIFLYTALIPWTFFSYAVSMATESLVGSSDLLKKVYFPRLVVPLAAVAASLLDFLLAFLVLFGLMIYFKIPLTLTALWIPYLILLTMVTALGVGLWLSAMNVQFRDVRSLWPFMLQAWLYITPVLYSFNEIPERLRLIYSLNPLTGIVHGFRWAMLGSKTPPFEAMGISWIVSLVILVSGLYYFRRLEKSFADVV